MLQGTFGEGIFDLGVSVGLGVILDGALTGLLTFQFAKFGYSGRVNVVAGFTRGGNQAVRGQSYRISLAMLSNSHLLSV